jgi:membrane protease YdiL (CAAX protease family)
MSGISASALLSIQVMQFIILGPVINIIPTLGEELGWRGYLLPKLRCFFSDRTALVVSGAIWGIWHLPVIVMGHNYGTGYAGYPWLGILAMVLFCIIFGTIEGYIAIKLESVIPAAMIHSALNAGAGLPLCLVKGEYNMLLGPAVTGLIGGLPFAVLAVVLFIKAGNTKTSNRKIVQP